MVQLAKRRATWFVKGRYGILIWILIVNWQDSRLSISITPMIDSDQAKRPKPSLTKPGEFHCLNCRNAAEVCKNARPP